MRMADTDNGGGAPTPDNPLADKTLTTDQNGVIATTDVADSTQTNNVGNQSVTAAQTDTQQRIDERDEGQTNLDLSYTAQYAFTESELADMGGQFKAVDDSEFADKLAAFNDARSGDSTALDPEAFTMFRHDRIREFKVGPYRFRDHIAKVPNSQLGDFFRAVEGLVGPDKLAITHVKELPVSESVNDFRSRIMRGAASSDKIPDRAQQQRTEVSRAAEVAPSPAIKPAGERNAAIPAGARPFLGRKPV